MKPGFSLKFCENVPDRVRNMVRLFCRGIERSIPVTHSVDVIFSHAITLRDKGLVVAEFDYENDTPRILVASKTDFWQGLLNETGERILQDSIAHEVAHYEQWRDGRKIQERGVAVRARTLARLARLEM